MPKQFGDMLKELRTSKQLTQEELAKSFNTGKASISNYENNYRLPDANTIAKYADYFNVTVDYILGKIESKELYKMDKEIPLELRELGIEYIEVTRELKESGLSPEDIKEIAQLARKIKGI